MSDNMLWPFHYEIFDVFTRLQVSFLATTSDKLIFDLLFSVQNIFRSNNGAIFEYSDNKCDQQWGEFHQNWW